MTHWKMTQCGSKTLDNDTITVWSQRPKPYAPFKQSNDKVWTISILICTLILIFMKILKQKSLENTKLNEFFFCLN